MNKELIKRIDEYLVGFGLPCMESTDMAILLKDCRAEIERLTEELKESRALGLKLAQDRETQDAENESLRDQNTALDEKLAEYSERKYVPMTDDELQDVWIKSGDLNGTETMRMMESAVIRRAGLEVVCKQTEKQE